MRLWIGAGLVATVALLTAAAVLEERRLVSDIAATSGQALLAHLAEMPDFRGDSEKGARYLAHLEVPLHGAGLHLELVSEGTAVGPEVIARRAITLRDGTFELRYASAAPASAVIRRSVLHHVAVGAAALVVLLAGAEWILRRRVLTPLKRFAHQVRFMRDGGGWKPRLPASDSELAELGDALEELGPALQAQVEQWVEAERRAGAARAVKRLRIRLREPKVRSLALLGDLQARGAVSAEAKPKLRALAAEIERVGREIAAEDPTLADPAAAPEGSQDEGSLRRRHR